MTLYTHTHTHTRGILIENKKKVASASLACILILIIVISFLLSGNLKSGKLTNKLSVAKLNETGLTEYQNADEGTFDTSIETVSNGSSDTVGSSMVVDTSNWNLDKVNIVTSGDGISVPVPKGFVMSGADSEKYVNGRDVEHKGTATNLEWTSEGDYPWAQNSDGVWVSSNQGVASSTSIMTSNFTVGDNEGQFVMEFSVSCQSDYSDYMMITLTNNSTGEMYTERRCNTTLGTAYDSLSYLTYNKRLSTGEWSIEVQYYKNSSTDTGLDSGYVKSAKIVNYDDAGLDTVTEHINGGLVIYEGEGEVTNDNAWEESKTRNQFVWVPVENPSDIYEVDSTAGKKKAKLYEFSTSRKLSYTNSNYEPGIVRNYDNEYYFARYGLQGMTRDKLLEELQTEFEATIESIEKYGGFYIGRYETGNVSNSNKTPVVQRMNTSLKYVTWYQAYSKIKNISTNENIKVNMIWGNLWDETLDWIVTSNSVAIDGTVINYGTVGSDSSIVGNYCYNSAFQYTDTSNNISTKSWKNTSLIPSGSTEYANMNNIYDMAGNIEEWTLEVYGSNRRIYRGGSCDYHYGINPVSTRGNNYSDYSNGYLGVRAYFYIK